MIGGGGEKKTLRLVAQYADACNLFGMRPTPQLARKLDILREHCAAVGRPYEEIEKTGAGLAQADARRAPTARRRRRRRSSSLARWANSASTTSSSAWRSGHRPAGLRPPGNRRDPAGDGPRHRRTLTAPRRWPLTIRRAATGPLASSRRLCYIYLRFGTYALVAQRIERLVADQKVAGSSPARRTTK